MVLSQLVSIKTRRSKRVGRGIGSGKGKTCGSGGKGQTARSGVAINGFEGGQMPIHRRLPKRGFVSHVAKPLVVTLSQIEQALTKGIIHKERVIQSDDLCKALGLVFKNGQQTIKVIGRQSLSAPLSFSGVLVTHGAQSAIEASGGSVS